MAYVDIARLQSYTRTVYSTETTPTLVDAQTYLDEAEKQVNEFSGRNWEEHTEVETIYNPTNGLILLKNTPVSGDVTSVVDDNGDDVAFTQIDGDFIKLVNSCPDKIIVTYQAGYTAGNVPEAVRKLVLRYWIQEAKQSESTTAGSSSSISLGPISITNSIGMSTIIGLSDDIAKYERKVRRLIR